MAANPSVAAAADACGDAPLTWQWVRLADLSPLELYAALALRQQVFVVEQRCIFLDADGMDDRCWHLLGWRSFGAEPTLSAYLRVVDAGAKFDEPSIGRVVTSADARRTGLGRILLAEGIARTRALYPGQPIRIGAQCYLEPFYASFGFRTVSAPYDEDGIAHVFMVLDPR
jgi:ElaA protein